MKKLRRVTEPEVISEFLKNEFYQEEFQHDRDQFERLAAWLLATSCVRSISTEVCAIICCHASNITIFYLNWFS